MKIKIGAILIILSIISCDMNSKFKKEYNILKSEKITIPNNLKTLMNGNDSLIQNFFDSELKLIVYTDSTSCNSCYIRKLENWNYLLEYAQGFNGKLKFYFIIAPKIDELNSVKIALRSVKFNYPVILDSEDNFKKSNPNIPNNKILHTFLLDKDNNVIMVGNPVNNSEVNELFKTTVSEALK